MHRPPRLLTNQLLVPLFLLGGCGGSEPATRLAFEAIGSRAPADVVTLGVEDDISPATPGIQVAVSIRTDGPVVLQVGEQTYQAEPDASGTATFSQVSLRPGDNALVAEDDLGNRAAIVARVNSPALLISGDDDHILSCQADDRDPATPGIQTALVILAPNIPASTPVSVWVGDERFDGAVSQSKAIVQVTLPAESGMVDVHAEATLGGATFSDDQSLAVQCAGCELLSVGDIPLARGTAEPLLVGPAHDEDDAPGMQATLVARAEGLPGTQVSLRVNGEDVATTSPSSDGVARFSDVTLPEQATVELTCAVPGASPEASQAQVRYDATPPPPVDDLDCALQGDWITCRWRQPEDPDQVGPLAAWSLRYLPATSLDEADWAEAVPVSGVPAPENDGIPMVAMFPLDPSLQGPLTLALQCQDAAGNVSPLSNRVTLHP